MLINWIEIHELERADTGPIPTFISTQGSSIVNIADNCPISGKVVLTLDLPEENTSYNRIKLERRRNS